MEPQMNGMCRPSSLLPWTRLLVVVLALAAFVIVPFAIWGEQMDASATDLVRSQTGKWTVALIGISLLVLDVVLPIPSSIVSITLCLLLGPTWGAACVFIGMLGAFLAGYLIGLLLPSERLRNWVGADTWDAFAEQRLTGSLLWIAASRPVPVLAEVTAILAGSLRLPIASTVVVASLSSSLVAIAYGLAAWVGLRQSSYSITILVLSAACLPAASWAALLLVRRSAGLRG